MLTFVLSIVTFAALVGWLIFGWGRDLFLVLFLAECGLMYWRRTRVAQILEPVEKRVHDLGLFADLLARIERESFGDERLRRLAGNLGSGTKRASRRIADLVRLLDWLNSRRNMLFAPFAVVLLWREQFAYLIADWLITTGAAVGPWLATLGEIEALASLAAYSYEHPSDPFPILVEDGPCFESVGLGHPLIPESHCVRNDVSLGGELRVLVVSGSNMSGKSTLLRSVGVNAVLAQAGAPVRARSLRLSPLTPGATLRIEDSIQAGRSRFFAEITRVRALVDLASGSRSLLFLLDEIFHGTNSEDRRRGAEAVVRGLLDRHAIGLVTTHDLALAQIADRLAPRAENVHFADQLQDGRMTFDYRMRPGVVRHSNALALMRAVGLDLDGIT
jgi:hypothetical protein